MKKRILSILLTLCMCICLAPASVFAVDGGGQSPLTVGETYYFDLSDEHIPYDDGRTVQGYLLQYVPFVYAGEIDAYVLNKNAKGKPDASMSAGSTRNKKATYGYTYSHNLFVAEQRIGEQVGWQHLDDDGLIYGRTITHRGVSYTLRSMSGGSGGGSTQQPSRPDNNEWDVLMNKGFIKNATGNTHGWVQDACSANGDLRIARGGPTGRSWLSEKPGYWYHSCFRPVLEIDNAVASSADELKVITLDLGGGSLLNGASGTIKIVVKGDEAFTAPKRDGLIPSNEGNGVYFKWKGSDGNLYDPGETLSRRETHLTACWVSADPPEQFSLAVGKTYYFDLSSVSRLGKIGKVNKALPDTTMHYVPFTYAGTVNAYAYTQKPGAATTEEYGRENAYDHSLFIADYTVRQELTWTTLSKYEKLVYGTGYESGGIRYRLRAPSGGSNNNPLGLGAAPLCNEWDTLMNKSSGFIKNTNSFTWAQDTATNGRPVSRSGAYARSFRAGQESIKRGYRPVLEVLPFDTPDRKALRAVTLDLNHGRVGTAGSIQIVVKQDEDYKAPGFAGLTHPDGSVGTAVAWKGKNDAVYHPGDTVPATEKKLTVQWAPNAYTVTLHENGGTIAEGRNVTGYTYGSETALPTAEEATREGYSLRGWYETADFSGSPVTHIDASAVGNKEYYARWSEEQFQLTVGKTYWFDLSQMPCPEKAYEGLPDATRHYMPFVFAGMVDSYVLNANAAEKAGASQAASQTRDAGAAYGYTYRHSLFIGELPLMKYVDYAKLKENGLIFGRDYQSGGIDYTLRAPTAGNQTAGRQMGGLPKNNEWEALLDKDLIRNDDIVMAWGQDTYEEAGHHAARGGFYRNYWGKWDDSHKIVGYFPVLEVRNTAALGAYGLKEVTLALNGGKVGDSSTLSIVVKRGSAFKAPTGEGLTRPDGDTGKELFWQGDDGCLYTPGETVPSEVTHLTARWQTPSYTVTYAPGAYGEGTAFTAEKLHGTALILSAGGFTRTGYTQVGWVTVDGGAKDFAFDSVYTADEAITLYPVWEEKGGYTVKWDTAGGTVIADKTNVKWNDRVLAGVALPQRSGWECTGFWYGERAVTEMTAYADLAENDTVKTVTLTARWADIAAPTVTGLVDGKTYCGSVSFTVSDNDGVKTVTVNDRAQQPEGGRYTLSPAAGKQTLVITDHSGNQTTVIVTVNNGHTPLPDDGDCTTAVLCRFCDAVVTPAAHHRFTGAWQRDDTHHWHVCQNTGCQLIDERTAHAGSDDGDCTTAVICRCGHVLLAARTAHTWTPWASNGNGRHTRACTVEGCTAGTQTEAKGHTGGTATCIAPAVCTVCEESYGDKDPQHHTALIHVEAKEATTAAEGNRAYWYCDGCGRYFADATAAEEITKADTITAKLKDDLQKDPAKTGDSSNVLLWIALLFVSGSVMVGIKVFNRKERHSMK